MWLVIPKNELTDLTTWGLTDDVEDCIGVLDAPPRNTLNRNICPNGKDGYDFILKKLTQCEVWVLDPRSRVIVGKQPASIPQELANAVTKIFVHFGGTQSGEMNLLWIDHQWGETQKTLGLPPMPNATVLPMSNQGGVAWQQQIADFRGAFTSGDPFRIDCLTSAWATAEQHFYNLLPIRRVVETLFPYYVDACYYVSLGPDEWKRANNDLANANRFARETVTSLKQSPDFGEKPAPGLAKSLESITEQVFPDEAGITKKDLSNFITSYKALSTKYTKILLNPNVMETHQEQTEAAPET
jgi:hypothetical protein